MANIQHDGSDLFATLEGDLEEAAASYPYCAIDKKDLPQCLAVYRDILMHFRERIQERHASGADGFTICALESELMDRLLRHIARQTGLHNYPGLGFAVAALGGYGRSELNPFSDVDLLILHGDTSEYVYETEIQSFTRFLWDMNLDIGHSVRRVAECLEDAREDNDLATSLLEARFLFGNPEILEDLRVRYHIWLRDGAGRKMALEKDAERERRLDRYGRTVNTQTPNVKESPGTLRDIHTARWIMQFAGIGSTVEDLRANQLLHEHEYRQYRDAFGFFLRVRNAVHFTSQRKTDLLEHLALPEIAGDLGYDGSRIGRSEAFMRDYYFHAGMVDRLTGHIIGRFKGTLAPKVTTSLRTDPSGLIILDTKLGYSLQVENRLHEHPEMIVRLFAMAAELGLDISGRATSCIERTVQVHRPNLSTLPEATELFRKLVEQRNGLAGVFRLMHQHGVLSLLIPEFKHIHWHYQYNFYHAYTTDEHSLRVVDNIERIDRGDLAAVPELTGIMSEVTAKSALYLAGLLHDVGKGGGRGHSLRGERLASQALERLGFDNRTIKLVRFLIREHLLLSHTSQRRDMDDDDTIKDVMRRVGGLGRLRMLTLLTFADLMAVSDNALTDWKKTLLLRLYNKAMMYFDRGFEVRSERSIQKLTDKVLKVPVPGIDHAAVTGHLSKLSEQYTRITGAPDVRRHLAGIARLDSDSAWASFHHHRDVTYLTVITRDYPSALFDICGTITASDINIVAAQIFTRSDGIIIDTFLVIDGDGNTRIAPDVQRTFKQNLTQVIGGEQTTSALITAHSHRWRRRRRNMIISPPRVNIHNDISERYTVIDVFANDYTGLLYDILQVFTSQGIDIHTAKIGTDEDQAADAFYVMKSGGGKIVDSGELDTLKTALIDTLRRVYEESIK